MRALELYAYNLDYMLNSNDSATDIGQEKKALLKYTYEQVLATQAEQVKSKSNNIYNIPEIGKLISIISSLVGIAFVALPTGIITTGFVEELNKEKEVDNNEKINKN